MGKGILRARESRSRAVFTEAPEGFDEVLEAVERDATRCFKSAFRISDTVIFVPQLYLGEVTSNDGIDKLLWSGALGDAMSSDVTTWISSNALTQSLHRINAVCCEVAQSLGVLVVALPATSICTSRNFYDDFHYTAAGAEIVATEIAKALPHNSRNAQSQLAKPAR